MGVLSLSIKGVRNLKEQSLSFHEKYNFFVGPNGSGKTSLLESIYLLGTSRSFRTHLYNKVVHHDEQQLVLVGSIIENLSDDQKSVDTEDLPATQSNTQMGIKKEKDGTTQIKIDGLSCRHSAELARHLPLQLYYPDSFKIIDSGPKIRREVLDWGVFHVKQDYFKVWAQYQRVLKQRNAWLRGADNGHMDSGTNFLSKWNSRQGICPWDKPLSDYAIMIHQMRLDYVEKLLPIMNKIITDFFSESFETELSIRYFKGWGHHADEDSSEHLLESLTTALGKDRERDLKMGYTHHGPHKADIIIQHNGRLIKDVFSRGQQKLMIIAIKLAQGILLSEAAEKECVYLLDDICAEFDEQHLEKVMNYLSKIPGQVFLTGVNEKVFLSIPWFNKGKVFHVKHGDVQSHD